MLFVVPLGIVLWGFPKARQAARQKINKNLPLVTDQTNCKEVRLRWNVLLVLEERRANFFPIVQNFFGCMTNDFSKWTQKTLFRDQWSLEINWKKSTMRVTLATIAKCILYKMKIPKTMEIWTFFHYQSGEADTSNFWKILTHTNNILSIKSCAPSLNLQNETNSKKQ